MPTVGAPESCLLRVPLGRLAGLSVTRSVRNSGGTDRCGAEFLWRAARYDAALGPKGRYQKLEPVVRGTFDVPFMARLSVGPTWRNLTPEQKRRAVQAYTRYIAAIYATRFDDYAGEKLQVLGEQQIKHGTLIKTQIIKSNGEPVAINYVVHDNDTAWQIRDIYLSGSISELATRRSDFANILRTSGIDGLIASLNKKADDLQG